MPTEISVIIPAYNEARRLPGFLQVIRKYLDIVFPHQHEVLVIDDGSNDSTASGVEEMRLEWPELRIIQLDKNEGKGKALRTGVAEACGEYLLVSDADGATPIAEERNLRQSLVKDAEIAIGSRRIRPNGVERSWFRNLAGRMFAWTVCHTLDLPIRDTQCGFKMFRRKVAQELFGMCRESGYLIDLEVLVHAHRLRYRVVEVPVVWRDVPGSKVHLIRDGWRMCRGLSRLMQIRLVDSSISRSTQCTAVGAPK